MERGGVLPWEHQTSSGAENHNELGGVVRADDGGMGVALRQTGKLRVGCTLLFCTSRL
jgi:hypothetical protein